MFRWLRNIIFGEPATQVSFGVEVPSERQFTPERKRDALLDNTTPPVPFEIVQKIEELVLSTSDLSQAVSRTVSFANTGHRVTFEGLSDSEAEKANLELELFAKNVFKPSAGMDSVAAALFRQITISGALSAEAVPEADFSGIKKVVLVPVSEVRFKRDENNDWRPYQTGTGEDVDLNEHQYMYIALMRNEKSPYAIPPFTAAVPIAEPQKKSLGRIFKVIDKFGLLGWIHGKKKVPQNYGLSEREFKEKLRKELDDFAKGFRANVESGAMVSYEDVSVEHKSVTTDARGAADLFQLGEEQLASAIDIDPSLLGRSYSTTETYAGVVHESFIMKLIERQRMVKRFLERVYWLHLILRGFKVDKVRVSFNAPRSLSPQSDAQAENFRLLNIQLKENAGWIDADQAAREAGYAKATGKKASAATMRALKKKTAILHRATTKDARGTNLIPFRREG